MDLGTIEPLTRIAHQFLPGRDTDFVDRLNSYITPTILVFVSVLIAGKQWLGDPLQCYLEQRYNGFEEQYIEHYCFINGTYFVPMNGSIPTSVNDREQAKLSYYQWLPIVLALQALLSSVPLVVWRALSPKSGINLKHAIRTSHSVVDKYGADRASKLSELAEFIDYAFGLQRHYRQKKMESKMTKCLKSAFCWVPFVGSKYGNYLPGFYVFFKLFALLVNVAQLFIFNAFLDSPTKFFAFDFAEQMKQGNEWSTTGLFPRITLCDFVLYTLGNKQRHTVQCVLSINFLVEKIYIFLWFWTFALCVLTIVNVFMWLERTLFDRSRRTFITSYLHAAVEYKKVGKEDEKMFNFVKYYLCEDGVFLFRLISFNVGIPITAALINNLWTRFLEQNNPKKIESDSRGKKHLESDDEKSLALEDSV